MVLLDIQTEKQIQDILYSLSFCLPELALVFIFLFSLLADLFAKNVRIVIPTLYIGLFIVAFLTLKQFTLVSQEVLLFNGMIKLTSTKVLFKLLCLFCVFITVFFATKDPLIYRHSKGSNEFFIILSAILVGLYWMVMASNLLMIYLSIEMVSICSYLLVAYHHAEKRSTEASSKYIVFGALATAVMLYGLSLLYAFTGALDVEGSLFLARLSKIPMEASSLALFLFLSGFIFKISAVPFHFYTPDVYEGSPFSVITFLSTAPKIAGFAILTSFISVFTFGIDQYQIVWPKFAWEKLLAIISIITLFVGNLSALRQTNLKRLMAYSSIAHTGFMLMALLVFSSMGSIALIYYLIAYVIMNMGAFMVIGLFNFKTGIENIHDFKGMAFVAPVTSACLVIFLASLIGLPPTAGFMGKFFLFSAVFESYVISSDPLLLLLLIAGVINTLISLFFYFRIVLYMYFRKSEIQKLSWKNSYVLQTFIILFAFFILLIGLFPSNIIRFIQAYLTPASHIQFLF